MALTIEDRNIILEIATVIYVGRIQSGERNIDFDTIISEATKLFDAADRKLPSELRKRRLPVNPRRPPIHIEGKRQ